MIVRMNETRRHGRPQITPDQTDAYVAATLRAIVAAHNLNMVEVAEQAGLSRSALYRKLRGESSFLRQEVTRLAAALDLPPEVLERGGPVRFRLPLTPTMPFVTALGELAKLAA